MNYSRRRGAGSSFLRILITVVSLAAVSFGAAFFWQKSEDSMIDHSHDSSEPPSSAATVSGSSADISGDDEFRDIDMSDEDEPEPGAVPVSEPESGSSPDNPQEDAETESYAREAIAGSVPPSKPEEYDYFNDAIFFGDSISTGIPLYMQTLVPNAAVIAAQGVSPGGALTSQCMNTNSGRETMLEAARAKGKRGKVYIMLGANALDYDEKPFIEGYSEFLQAVKEEYPDAVIYVQSMLPVTANVNNVYSSKNINNGRISSYNRSILEMALNAGVNYVDVAQCMTDENGMLPTEASPLDGMHLTPEYYIKWFDYLRSHTVGSK